MASSAVLPFRPPLAVGTCCLSRPRLILPRSLFSSASGRSIRLSSPVWATNFDFTPPPIDHDVSEAAMGVGATISEDGIVESYGNDKEAIDAAYNGLAVVDLSHFGRIRVSGEDRASFLHNQSTANFECLHEGEGCDTVFVSPTARTIDISHAWIMKNAIILVVSPDMCRSITEMLTKYIFYSDKVEITDITKQTSFFVLLGPKSNEVMENLSLGETCGMAYGSHRHYSVNDLPVTVGSGNLLSKEGFSLLMSPAAATTIWDTLLSRGATPMGSKAWERLRILQGRPAPGRELTKDYIVLEAGLWNAISLDKGCYKGQETIARLITYNGVKQNLRGFHLSAAANPGSPIMVDGKKVGTLTSCTQARDSSWFGLGYIKREFVSEGTSVLIGDHITGTVTDVPFLSKQCQPVMKT
ncbi:hypothetical protein MLD38_022873 [Melastoma candidum]|uniref:Uncharacterized protein n=1 Tax=Melastoma candidum TaxID=119954 RepID=A0ACB9QLA3_9MYRT|nr:hypothetical protein MLD38_022873 [Melastoma candidum]